MQDTGHNFSASRDTATGIAARFFMNRNYFVADPDAFNVSTQVVPKITPGMEAGSRFLRR